MQIRDGLLKPGEVRIQIHFPIHQLAELIGLEGGMLAHVHLHRLDLLALCHRIMMETIEVVLEVWIHVDDELRSVSSFQSDP